VRSGLKKSLLPVLLSFFGTFIVLFPSNPANMTLPSRDSGVFLYVGWRLLKGDIPYRDVWDHKPPLIYFVDALGLLLNPQSLLGVWLLQFCFLFLTILFLYNSLNESLGTIPAVVGMIVLTSGLLTILDQGNVTEEYALVFQTLGLWLFVRSQKNNYPLRLTFWIGLCGGLAFYFKQTTIGIWIAFALFLLWIRILQKKSPVIDLFILAAGWGLLSIILGLVFASQHALNDFWYEAFLYNFVYIGKHEAFSRLIPVILKGFLFLSQGAVLYLALLGWSISLAYVWFNRKSFINIQPIILLAIINFPIEVVLITISGRSILHYYLTPLPVMAILSGFLVYSLGLVAGRFTRISSPGVMKPISSLALLAVLVLQIGQVQNYPVYIANVADNTYAPVIAYVTEHTKSDDKVLVLGAESVVNFLTRREAPTRYVYQYPLLLVGSRGMYNEYFQQIIQNKPVLIIDAPGGYQFDENMYKPMQIRSTIVSDGVQFLLNNYQRVATFGDWIIYRLKEGS
jgi:hypothetical protein